jgi:hypothetical protein
MRISLGNDNMFLSRSYEVNSTGTCTENPRVGSSILSLGTNTKASEPISEAFSYDADIYESCSLDFMDD